jgi:FKBP-type peptidyl-prolyl cis-trans isomerase SlyD
MKVADKHVVQFHYSLKDENGEELESNQGMDPIAYLHGENAHILPGLKAALEGKAVGEQVSVTLEPADAFGEVAENAEQRVPVKHLQGATKWKKGMTAVVNTEQGQRQVTIVKMGKFMATVDTNHPFAGKKVSFDIDIADVRPATEEELDHGHAHGVGGHQH